MQRVHAWLSQHVHDMEHPHIRGLDWVERARGNNITSINAQPADVLSTLSYGVQSGHLPVKVCDTPMEDTSILKRDHQGVQPSMPLQPQKR